MKPIYIIGAGGAAKEIYLLVKEINAQKPQYDFKGFIDVIEKEVKLLVGGKSFSVFAETIFLQTCKEDVSIAFAVGNTAGAKNVIDKYFKHDNFEFPNLIHPNVILDESVAMGVGNIIASACIFTLDISLQSFNSVGRGTHIGHDCTIGSYNVFNPCAVISGGVVIKDENLIGSNATVLQYLKIDSKNKIGAGAVVTKNVGSNSTLIGIPAKSIK